MAKLAEFASWAGSLRLCDRCDALMVNGWMADQVFLRVYICESCHARQAGHVAPPVARPPQLATGEHTRHKHTRHGGKQRMFPELPRGTRLPGGIGPRLQGLRNLKKAGKMTEYEIVRRELLQSLAQFSSQSSQ